MLDITLFRNETTLERIRDSEARRFRDPAIVDKVADADCQWRKATHNRSACSRVRNIIGRLIGQKMKAKQFAQNEDNVVSTELLEMDINDVQKETLEPLTVEQLKVYSKHITDLEKQCRENEESYLETRDSYLEMVGNILDTRVPISRTEDDNEIIEEYNAAAPTLEMEYELQTHDILLQRIGGVDFKAGQKVAGNRGYYLRGPAVYLAQALIQLSLKILGNKEYEPIQTPYFMRGDMLDKVSQLNDFEDRLYRVDQGYSPAQDAGGTFEDDDNAVYLIATSEQPLVALNQDKKFAKTQLPIRYAGISTCFRTETGRHGQDTAGIFRVHQFDKIEQFVLADPTPDDEHNSSVMMEEMIENCRTLLKALNISYRIVSIVSKELNLAASIKYDIEGLFPASTEIIKNTDDDDDIQLSLAFRELVSCSNCTDYQARRVNTRYANTTDSSNRYVHMLNSTMCAIPRIISAVLESNQTSEGIVVPNALRPYMPEKYANLIEYIN